MKNLLIGAACALLAMATSVSAFGDIRRSNVSLGGGTSVYGFQFTQTGGIITHVTTDKIIGDRAALLPANTIVVPSTELDIYDADEVQAWVAENFNDDVNTYAVVLTESCKTNTIDPDAAAGQCKADDGIAGSVSLNGSTASRW